MPRPEYPSDEKRRKTKPAVRVHLSVLNHPRYGEVFDDPESRGIVVGIWLIAARAHVSKTSDLVSLSRADLRWITGRAQDAHAERALRACCERMAYSVQARGERVEILVRNFTKKQGFAPPTAESDSALRYASESPSPSESKSAIARSAKAALTKELTSWFDSVFVASFPENRQGTQLKSARNFVTRSLRPDEATRAEIMRHLAAWKASHDWTKDGGEYAPGLKTFFDNRYHERMPATGGNGAVSRPYTPC